MPRRIIIEQHEVLPDGRRRLLVTLRVPIPAPKRRLSDFRPQSVLDDADAGEVAEATAGLVWELRDHVLIGAADGGGPKPLADVKAELVALYQEKVAEVAARPAVGERVAWSGTRWSDE